MKIIDTFVPHLYAFKFSDELPDELERVFDEWVDPMYLFQFFEANEQDLDITIEQAIDKVQKEAKFLRNKLIELANEEPNKLNELFKNLNNNEYTAKLLQEQKARNRWLRLYAIKIDDDNYIITGGTIKLDNQHLMKDRKHTLAELNKLNRCRDFLKDEGVIDNDSFQEIFF
ncbi:MAG TPA: hypothetical protein DCS66_00590 [Flavobacteriaceae bacterium]|nr:hypothetical protein [Flavobacteriaceae bacterium]HAT63086.1 hypothetical protein [Flavobacteriaceae bacterium]|tara:strand:- start:275 stop:790 length:516 start_codon:yes stop_codon:yes gene_type:complete